MFKLIRMEKDSYSLNVETNNEKDSYADEF